MYLASINPRTKPMAKVVYIFPVMELLWACKKHIMSPPANPESTPQPNHLLDLTLRHQVNTLPALTQPGTKYQTTRASPCAQHLLELFKLANPKILTLLYLAFSCRNPIKGYGPCFPFTSSRLLTESGASPHGPAWTWRVPFSWEL